MSSQIWISSVALPKEERLCVLRGANVNPALVGEYHADTRALDGKLYEHTSFFIGRRKSLVESVYEGCQGCILRDFLPTKFDRARDGVGGAWIKVTVRQHLLRNPSHGVVVPLHAAARRWRVSGRCNIAIDS